MDTTVLPVGPTAPQPLPTTTDGKLEPTADQKREAKRAALLAKQRGELQEILKKQFELTGKDPLAKEQSPVEPKGEKIAPPAPEGMFFPGERHEEALLSHVKHPSIFLIRLHMHGM